MTPDLLEKLRAGDSPLPLSNGQALAQAYRLRVKHGFSYRTLARLMGEYHGAWHDATYWQRHCRLRGAPAKRPGQLTPTQRKAAA